MTKKTATVETYKMTTSAPTAEEKVASYQRQRIALRSWLLGRGWTNAVRAMTFAESYHCHLRKDGVTPEFAHQVHIALNVTTLVPHLLHQEETVIVAFLHDVCEDYDVEFDVIEAKFGKLVADAVRALTKEHKGVKRDPHEVAATQAACPIASVVKGLDRNHNQATLVGVFTHSKIASYLDETRTFILPMLKTARRSCPEQDGAYQNIRVNLLDQIEMLEAVIG